MPDTSPGEFATLDPAFCPPGGHLSFYVPPATPLVVFDGYCHDSSPQDFDRALGEELRASGAADIPGGGTHFSGRAGKRE
jgi:hypothetical protein